jgi:cytochrome c oxidase cbb3-type subunit 4
MYRQFYEGTGLTHLPVFALVLFMFVFVAAIVRMFVFGRSGDYDHLARIPISEGGSDAEVRHE